MGNPRLQGACFLSEEPRVNKEHISMWCLNIGWNLQWFGGKASLAGIARTTHSMEQICFLTKNSSGATESVISKGIMLHEEGNKMRWLMGKWACLRTAL